MVLKAAEIFKRMSGVTFPVHLSVRVIHQHDRDCFSPIIHQRVFLYKGSANRPEKQVGKEADSLLQKSLKFIQDAGYFKRSLFFIKI